MYVQQWSSYGRFDDDDDDDDSLLALSQSALGLPGNFSSLLILTEELCPIVARMHDWDVMSF